MKQTKTIKRVLLLCVTLLLLATVMVSCGGKNAKIDTKWTSADTDAVTYFSRILPLGDSLSVEDTKYTARELFVAASRGYDLGAEGFDDSAVVLGEVKEVDLDAAKAALDIVKPTDDASQIKFSEFRDALTAENVKEIVARMGVEVDLAKESNPLVWVGKFLGVLTNISGGNYVIALFFFAVIIEVLLLYFGVRQQKDSIKRARLSPKERAIRKKYAGRNDQKSMQAMNQEIQQMYQEAGASPMSGCLPMLIQMPIVIMLYNIVVDPLRYVLGQSEQLSLALSGFATTSRAAGGLGMSIAQNNRGSIELLSRLTEGDLAHLSNFAYYSNAAACADELSGVMGGALPNFNLFGLNMGLVPGFRPPYLLLLVPVLTFLVYFASMKINRKLTFQPAAQDPQMGCSNNIMDLTMPLMSVWITFMTPAAIGIYWIFKCLIGMLKQFVLAKLMPLPVFTEEDYKRAERELKGKARPADSVPSRPAGAAKRSLHHIDDDEEALPPRVHESGEEPDYLPAERRQKQSSGKEIAEDDEPTFEKKGTLGAAPLKEDRKKKK